MSWISRFFPARRRDISAAEVADTVRNFVDGTGGDRDWDDFESIPVRNRELDRIRREAAWVGPPDADMGRLRELLAEAEALVARAP